MIMARILCTQRVHQGIQMSQGSANGNDSHGSLTNKTASQPTSPGETWLVTAQTLDIPHKVWVSSWTGQSGPSLTSIDGVKFRGIQINASHCCCYKVNLNVGTGGGGGGKCYETQLCWSCQTWDRGEKGVGTEFFSTNFFYAKTQI